MNEKAMIRNIVEHYVMTGCEVEGEIKIQRVQDHRTTYVEPGIDGGRSVYMNEFTISGVIYWAGYSSRSQTVYLSMTA